MKQVYHDQMLTLWLGNAVDWPNKTWVDFVFTNPYGEMPICLAKTPGIIHQWEHRRTEAERWSHMKLSRVVSKWNRGREIFWANSHVVEFKPLDLVAYNPESPGWYPEELVEDILSAYVRPGQTVWDGFMGRGTIGKICRNMGIHYIGVEQLERHMDLAKAYLEVA